MNGPAPGRTWTVRIDARNHEYHPDDHRWLGQLATLHDDLRTVADVAVVTAPGPRTGAAKGGFDEVAVALASSGVLTAVVELCRSWLHRDRARQIDIRWTEDGAERLVTLSGGPLDAGTVRVIADAAARRIGGAPCPDGTEPS